MQKRFSIMALLIVSVIAWVPLAGWQQAQPAAGSSEQTYTVKIDFDVGVKMREGVELSADVYRPEAEGRFPVILNRTPYTKTGSLNTARFFVERGYVFVAMDVRGRGDSDGEFVPYRNDGQDGYDAVEWCAAQPWATGKGGTPGGASHRRGRGL